MESIDAFALVETLSEEVGKLAFDGQVVLEKFYPGKLIQQFRADEKFLLIVDTDEWDNRLLIVLLDPSFNELDKIGIELFTCSDTFDGLDILDEETIEFTFLGRWRLTVLHVPQKLVFKTGVMGPLFWVGEPRWRGDFVKKNGYLNLEKTDPS